MAMCPVSFQMRARLLAVVLLAGCIPDSNGNGVREWLMIGDSNTSWLTTCDYPEQLQALHRDMVITNGGIFGTTAAWWVANDALGGLLAQYQPDAVSIALGTNDLGDDPTTIVANLQALYARATGWCYPRGCVVAQVATVPPIYWPETGSTQFDVVAQNATLQAVNGLIRATFPPSAVVDFDSWMAPGPDWPGDVFPSYMYRDGVHLNCAGQATRTTYADRLILQGAYVDPAQAIGPCGNGLIESGEQCDDGSANGAFISCCTATCTFQVSETPCAGGTCAGDWDTCATNTTTLPSVCGNGILEPGEDCDDGGDNGQSNSCCTATCRLEPAGTACADEGDLCTEDACAGTADTCTHPIAPSPTCATPMVPGGASLLLQTIVPGKNRAQFKWGKGPAAPLAAFGTPEGGERVCVYEQTGPNTYAVALRGGPSVGRGSTWTGKPAGWTFKSKTGAPDGITEVIVRSGAVPFKAKVRVQAKGNPSFPSGLPLQTRAGGIVAQFKTSLGTCWGATFSTPIVNTATKFRAKSD
jgi:lysophospholipase L1-like esterase